MPLAEWRPGPLWDPSHVTGRSRWHWQPEAESCRRGSRRGRRLGGHWQPEARYSLQRGPGQVPSRCHGAHWQPPQLGLAQQHAGVRVISELVLSFFGAPTPGESDPRHNASSLRLSLRVASTFNSSWGFEKRCSPPITSAPYVHHLFMLQLCTHTCEANKPSPAHPSACMMDKVTDGVHQVTTRHSWLV